MKYVNEMNDWFYSKSKWDDGEDCFPVEHYVGGPNSHILGGIYENEEDAKARVEFFE